MSGEGVCQGGVHQGSKKLQYRSARNYDIEEPGLSYKAAMVLYTKEVCTDVINHILENSK